MSRYPSLRRRHNFLTSPGAPTILSNRTWNEKSQLPIYPNQDLLGAKKSQKRRRRARSHNHVFEELIILHLSFSRP
jgi:hypothetical protein